MTALLRKLLACALVAGASPTYAASFECLENNRADCDMRASGAIHCTDERDNPTLRYIKSRLVITEATLVTCLSECLPPLPVTTVEDGANKRTNVFGAKTGIGALTVVIDHATGEFIETIIALGSHTTTKIGRCVRK
ncbi:hypothetical protein [Bosea sp. NBC_00550]|uniref:hypothetical protein n=1 Tax=Bosea sp. NBC_00550 TaxID=2969621 RepID=UPI00222F9A14|nr:hypothetical protein [Bosea sp. NBC_00550]UZF91630.1 hypothetical protein NWE53_21345 [Bosea sp. NBC_00550]